MTASKKIKRGRNFFPSLLLAVIFWISLIIFSVFLAPTNGLLILTNLCLLFLALFLTLALLLANSRRGFLAALWITLFLVFRWQNLAEPLHLIILTAIFLSLELYFSTQEN